MPLQRDRLNTIVRQIVDLVQPIKIILFGSASRESENKESDYDILVIMPEGTHRRNTSKLLYKKVAESGIPVDIIVATPEDIEKHKNNIGLIYRAILAEGRELYAA
jgi:predicted nucleotidyltransferase